VVAMISDPSPWKRIYGAGYCFYDWYEFVQERGFNFGEDTFNEMCGPWGSSRKFDTTLFRKPEIPENIPERFDYYSFADIIVKYPVVMPDIASKANNGDVVSLLFVEKMRKLGFHDFLTYPVRVHLVESMEDFSSGSTALRSGKFPYRDDLYVMLQLTNSLFPLLEPMSSGEPIDPNRQQWDGGFYTRKDYLEIKYPLFFRIQHKNQAFYCNSDVASLFTEPEFVGMQFR
jgi:hypothetical protein